MIHRCLACEAVFERDEAREGAPSLCVECAPPAPTPAAAALAIDTIRARCPACGLTKDVPTYRTGEPIRCKNCSVLYFASMAPPAAEAPSDPAPPPAMEPRPRPAPEVREPRRTLLRWVFPLALVPLVWFTVAPGETARDRLARMFERDPDLQERVHAAKNDDQVFQALPEHRIEGALLPYGSQEHWWFALASAGAGLLYFGLFWPFGRARLKDVLLVTIFTGTVGIFLLLAVQAFSEASEGFNIRGGGLGAVIYAILRFIALSYRMALDPAQGFWSSLGGFTFGIGLCEELCKALPLMVHMRSSVRTLDWRGLVLWAVVSGLGFGVAEGIHYSAEFYNGVGAALVYVVRFIPCVALHSVWTGITAIALYTKPDPILRIESRYDVLPAIVGPVIPSMILHGLYDTLLKKDQQVWALLIAAGSFGYFLWLLEKTRARQKAAIAAAGAHG